MGGIYEEQLILWCDVFNGKAGIRMGAERQMNSERNKKGEKLNAGILHTMRSKTAHSITAEIVAYSLLAAEVRIHNHLM